MATINCYIPLKLRLQGELSENEWVNLEEKLVALYVRAIERSLRELAKSGLIAGAEVPNGDLASALGSD